MFRRRVCWQLAVISVVCSLTFLTVRGTSTRHNPARILPAQTQKTSSASSFKCEVVLDVDPACVRLLQFSRTPNSGLGHQLSEVLQAMFLSRTHSAALRFDGFSKKVSRHGHSYEFVTSLLGLEFLSVNSLYPVTGLRLLSFNDTTSTECNVLYQGNYKDCPGGDCFQSPFTALILDQYKSCLRGIAYERGTWALTNPFHDRTSKSTQNFNVVWHVRLGDLELHGVDDAFYYNVYSSLSDVFAQMENVQHYFIAEWSLISEEKKKKYSSKLCDVVGVARLLDVDVQEAFTHMMHSDLLIGSGSTLPIMAAVFSSKTVYVNVSPKIGWNFLNEYLSDGLSTTKDGVVINHKIDVLRRLNHSRSFVPERITLN